jgi:formyltetrahydrofolate-dependent phosphoribosylglycinamide formyltransferase
MDCVKAAVGILISGRGSNMVALLGAGRNPDYPAEIVLVISNRPDAPGIQLAAEAGVETAIIDHRRFGKDRAAHEVAIDAGLRRAGVQIVCLAGYMRLLTPFLVNAWRGKMLNIHPSLLPAFPGLHTHARALGAGAKLHGCTVHLVTETMDEGPILAQAAVPVLPDDDEVILAARVLVQEHRIYPAALAAFASHQPGPAAAADAALANPLPLAASFA